MKAIRHFEPAAVEWRTVEWGWGAFDTARRPYTESAGGTICLPRHLVLVTLRGGAGRLTVRTDDGHRYSGDDRAGAVSVVPAYRRRAIEMNDVRSVWASISLDPAVVEDCVDQSGRAPVEIISATNTSDPFLAALLSELARTESRDGALDVTYCEAMAHAVTHHLVRRYGRRTGTVPFAPWLLPAARLRHLADYVEANLAQPLRVRDLAAVVGVSEGHLHRALRATTGKTPLQFITERRISRAVQLLRAPGAASVTEVAVRVGFASPGHFGRVFHRVTGLRPGDVRSGRSLPGPPSASR